MFIFNAENCGVMILVYYRGKSLKNVRKVLQINLNQNPLFKFIPLKYSSSTNLF